ncbi:MAG: hypothetical protein QW779_04695, partial [Nitrososphaerales archaeon]
MYRMDNIGKKALASIFIFFLIFSTLSIVIPAFIPNVEAQVPYITTSADEHGRKFWGNATVRILVTDPARANDGKPSQNVSITITYKDKYGNVKATVTRNITEISDSGNFELFILDKSSKVIVANPQAWPRSVLFRGTTAGKLYENRTALAKEDTITIEYSSATGSASTTLTYDHTRG